MDRAAPAIFAALEHSRAGGLIRESLWIYPLANVGHVVALVCFAGAVAVMDLRLAGALAATAPGRLLSHARTAALLAFLGLAATGSVLFTAEASHVIVNPVFQIKLGLILLGLVNVAVFEFAIAPKVKALPPLAPLPAAARTAGILSIAVWLAVAVSGRAIAYF